ncbi:MAG: hypothetical protein B6D58_02885 [candidate division Zixibacteria bacterium 4484_95]|nr:MAG: hypothetical protein B6D58_02885 [candidate division Zixibacteria bacterium 4484_95]RKX20575.1 MAG: hypothetical protein DRP26_01395 [candidate division Zixibacteria bacterium]
MRRILLPILIISLSSIGWTGQLKEPVSIEGYFSANEMVANNFFAAEKSVGGSEEIPLTGDIYEFETKSTKRAFLYSMLIPGTGEFYAGSRIKPAVFLGIEALLWTGYFVYHNKGDDKKKEYKAYADDHYSPYDYMSWWNSLNPAKQDSFSHRLPWDDYNNSPIRNHEYYENIGKYNQFQYGWDDINTYPDEGGILSPHRDYYLTLRKKSNDYYQNASTAIMLSLGNRIISAFDAALTAKNYNKGQKRYVIKLKARDFGNGQVPILTCTYRF